MIDPRAAALAYVRYVLETLSISPTALAQLAGVSSTTLTRPLNDPSHKFIISTATIGKIAFATKINPAPFFGYEDPDFPHTRTHFEHASHPGSRAFVSKRSTINIVGEISTGDWLDNTPYNSLSVMPVFLTHTWYEARSIFGVAVVDDRASMIARIGEILVCVDIDLVDRPIYPTAVVIVQRLREEGRKIELSACYMQKTTNGWVLRPAAYGLDQEVQFQLPELESHQDGTRVLGVVQYVVRSPFVLM